MSDARDFLLGFLLSSTLFLGTFASYILFCPHAKKSEESPTGVINQFYLLPEQQLLPSSPIKPKQPGLPFLFESPKKEA